MATTDNRQLISKLTFYPSEPLFAYASGYLYHYEGWASFDEDVSIETMNSLIALNPSKKHILRPSESGESFLRWWTRPSGETLDYSGSTTDTVKDMDEDFFMVLGHNFNERNQFINYTATSFSPIVNSCVNSEPDFDGWSYMENSGNTSASQKVTFKTGNSCEVGSFVWGKKWEAPQNTDISSSISYNYGIKNKKTIAGKNITNINYYKPNKWLLDAWELDDTVSDTRDTPTESRNGLRTWNVRWSFLQDKYATNHNNMRNSNLSTQDSDSEYSTGADGTSLYNSTDGIDFVTSVLKPTLGGTLPMVVQISESNNPDQFAIVRMTKYKITQKNPKFVDISLTLEEQV